MSGRPPRLHVALPLAATAVPFDLPPDAARHVQVLRLQPGDAAVLFDGRGGEWQAVVVAIGRRHVTVQLGAWLEVDRELAVDVTLAVGMPANERMDALVEKATELGVRALQPLVCERSVLRLHGERADRKLAHWQAIACAACEQCGRTRPPLILPVASLPAWLQHRADAAEGQERRWLLSPDGRDPLPVSGAATDAVVVLSGPEGGLTGAEEAEALQYGFGAVSLGPRVLRADTAPLAALARLGGWPNADPAPHPR